MPVELPKVAVLLAAYNGNQWIEQQLASILGQLHVDVTVYISIDPSTDGTEAKCAELSADDPRIVLLADAGRFGGAARNFFRLIRDVDLGEYDFVAFADQDDVWYLDKLSRATQTIISQQADAYSSNVTAFWPNGRELLLDKSQSQVPWDYLFEAAGPGCTYVLGKNLVTAFKASVLNNWSQLQKVSLHDWYCYAFARSHGFTWCIDAQSTMHYRQHDKNQVGANTGFSSLLKRYATIQEGWWFRQVQLITRLVGKGDDPFVRRWLSMSRSGLLLLSVNASQCRRRRRDKVLFFCVCWLTAIFGRRAE